MKFITMDIHKFGSDDFLTRIDESILHYNGFAGRKKINYKPYGTEERAFVERFKKAVSFFKNMNLSIKRY